MLVLPLLLLALVAVEADQSCYQPFDEVGDQCLYVETGITKSWDEARDFCVSLAGDGANGNLATFPTCESFTSFVRHLALNAPTDSSLWVGARTVFSVNSWEWVTGESLQTGVPYWAYPDNGVLEDCAAADGSYYYRLVDDDCTQNKGFVCMMPSLKKSSKVDPVPFPGEDCPHEGIIIGEFCYIFKEGAESWSRAEEECRKEHENFGGMLYHPSDCDEFTHMAHHLEADEKVRSYWVGGIDVSGNEEWTWVNGDLLPGGPPYWASGEPSHVHDNQPNEHCTVMDPTMRYYLRDVHCNEHYSYICKLHHV